MHADRYFEIGSTHAVCEDYALAGSEKGLSWAIVSDGCSSSKNTDVGARLLSHIAKEGLQQLYMQGRLSDQAFLKDLFPMFLRHYVIVRALEVQSTLHLDYDAFDATLLVAFTSGSQNTPGTWGVIAFGDGNVVLKFLGGNTSKDLIEKTKIHYDSNAPYYLSYGMSVDRDKSYRELCCYEKRLNVLKEQNGEIVSSCNSDPSSPWAFFTSGLLNETGTPAQIILFSDGIDSYESKDSSFPFNSDEALKSMIGYKVLAGEFVQRRMKAFRKECEKASVSHYDDVSCAALTLIG